MAVNVLIPAIDVSVVNFLCEYCTCIINFFVVDWWLNLKIVDNFEDTQNKMCYKDFKCSYTESKTVYNSSTHFY